MTIRVAVIGAGIMGADHARIIAQDIPGAVLQVVCDASGERARKVAMECGAIDIARDPSATICRSDVDAIVIASPDETHAELTLAAIRAGKPVLCEKPLSQSAEECLKVIEAEVAQGRQSVQLGFMRRFDPSYTEMKGALTQGLLGNALLMHNFHRNVEAPSNFTGQMAISNSAPHEFDIARFVLGVDFKAVSAFQAGTGEGAPVFMVVESHGGQLINIEINNNAAYGYDVRGELVGEQGSVLLNAAVHARYNLGLNALERYAADWRPRFAEAYRLQDKAFVEFVRTGMFPPQAANAWDGYCAALAALAGIDALVKGQRVELNPAPQPSLYQR